MLIMIIMMVDGVKFLVLVLNDFFVCVFVYGGWRKRKKKRRIIRKWVLFGILMVENYGEYEGGWRFL